MSKLNPQAGMVEIGIRTLKELQIYPLSLGEQIKLSDIITKAVSQYVNSEDQSDAAFASFITNTIQENIVNILSLVTDEKGEELLDMITNTQAVDIASLIYDMNYGGPAGNLQSLVMKAKNIMTVK